MLIISLRRTQQHNNSPKGSGIARPFRLSWYLHDEKPPPEILSLCLRIEFSLLPCALCSYSSTHCVLHAFLKCGLYPSPVKKVLRIQNQTASPARLYPSSLFPNAWIQNHPSKPEFFLLQAATFCFPIDFVPYRFKKECLDTNSLSSGDGILSFISLTTHLDTIPNLKSEEIHHR